MHASIGSVAAIALLFSLQSWAAGPPAADSQPAAKPVHCRTAVVNPVSRHAECVDPPGAPVAEPPNSASPPCPSHPHASGPFNIESRCTPAAPSSN